MTENPIEPDQKSFLQTLVSGLSLTQKIKYSVFALALLSVLFPLLMRGAGFNAHPAYGFALFITAFYWVPYLVGLFKGKGGSGRKLSLHSVVGAIQTFWKSVVTLHTMRKKITAEEWLWLEVQAVNVHDGYTDVTLTFDTLPRLKVLMDHKGTFERLFKAQTCEIHDLGRNTAILKIRYTAPLEGTRETVVSRSIPVLGRSVTGRDINFDLVDPFHTGVQGQTRSGKSAFMYTCISQVCHRDDVLIAGFDPTNVLLSKAKDLHSDMVVLGLGDMAAIKHLCDTLLDLLDARLLHLSHHQIDKIEEFSSEMPIVWTIFEETPGLMGAVKTADAALKPNERVGPYLQNCLNRLLMEGAKVGFRVWVLAQRFDASVIGGDARGQLVRRVTFSVDTPEAVKMLHPAVTPEGIADCLKFPPGMAIYQLAGHTDIFKGDYIDYPGYLAAWNPLRRKPHSTFLPPVDDMPPAFGID